MTSLVTVLMLIIVFESIMILKKAAATSALGDECEEKCGNITIPQPFGIVEGCYRPGFRLRCNNNTGKTPRLFLDGDGARSVEVTGISVSPLRVRILNYLLASMNTSTNFSSISWRALENTPYTFLFNGDNGTINTHFVALGCDVSAYLVDLNSTTQNNPIIASCSTICKGKDDAISFINKFYYECNGIFCCSVSIPDGLKSYEIRLMRSNQTRTWDKTTSWAFVGYPDQKITSINAPKSVFATLAWTIDDQQTCEAARKNTNSYACGPNTQCIDHDDKEGYNCECTEGYQGNPYDKPHGCQVLTAIKIRTAPEPNCPTKCGNISVPFPFGIGAGCSRESGFNLSCNSSAKTPTLSFNGPEWFAPLDQIELAEGKLKFLPEYTDLSTGRFRPLADGWDTAEYQWVIQNETCIEAQRDIATYACRSINSTCYQAAVQGNPNFGYRCQCQKGYEGNPYLSNGCTDINECILPEALGCKGVCVNVPGHYECVCPPQMQGDPWKACYPVKKSPDVLGIIIGMSTSVALLLLFSSIYFLHQRWKERIVRIKERQFRKNRGLFLQQLISSNNDLAERTKIFSLEELEKATNNFDATRILGHGGHGTVYKGILADQRISAIKKAKIAKQKEIDEFINEVVLLSQINHKNVVRLFGCCLESEVPLLVYEFVPNGTLNDHLERHSSLSWEERLRIATEASGALAYLHSSTSISIFHRDVKSSNILLDDNCSAKVSDFGASRSLPPDQTHLTTIVQGTLGYLDPEYYQTGQLTEKSDVYSFGVILLELLTGEKPISSARCPEEINLCSRFLLAKRENRLFQIFEGRVTEEGTKEELTTIAMLAEMCLQPSGDERPTMKEVEGMLEDLRRSKNRKQQSGTERQCAHTDNLQSLPSSSHSLYKLVEGYEVISRKNVDSSRMFSMEKEFILSLDFPR